VTVRARIGQDARMRRDLVLLAYDIACDRQRARTLDAVRGFGIDSQLSVHECRFTAGERREIWHRLRALVDQDDRLLLLVLDPRSRIETLGTPRSPLDPALHYVG
jgi:CRISPR/Cas system-associated endoribonuclease Cas2